MRRLLRALAFGWILHFKQLSRSPFELWIVIASPIIFATLAYLLFRATVTDAELLVASIASAVMGIWSVTGTSAAAVLQRQRRLGLLELLVASPTPFWAIIAPITAAIATVGIYSLAIALALSRLLFGTPIAVAHWTAFVIAIPPMIVSIGLLGFLFTAAMVRFRAAWALGNMFEWPVWTACGLLVPVVLLPTWVEPLSWLLAPTWGMSALRQATLGGNPWDDIGMCVVLAIAYGSVGALLLRRFLRSARIHASLALS